jgi:CubicO group peptidase (beta-lactamase class C family)
MGRFVRTLRNLIIFAIVFYLALFTFTKVIRYPEPIAAIKLGLAPASKTPTLMPWHEIKASANPIQLPPGNEAMPESVIFNSQEISFNDFLKETKTNSFLVIRNGVLTYEWYREGFSAQTQFPSYSVAKTMTSILIGRLITEKKISESDLFVDYFPELKNGSTFDQITIRSLLDMQSGVGVSDDYPTGPQGWGVAIAQMYATTDIDWFMKNNRKMAFDPGSNSEYRSVDTQMLGMIIKKITGERVADYFQKEVWEKIGSEFPATWNVDRVGGTEKTFCCFNASARDYARVGLLFINGGYSGSVEVIENFWLKRMTSPVTQLDNDWGYAAQTWHPFPEVSMALGLHGQFIFTDRSSRTVIIKLSDNPTGSDNEVATAKVLHFISQLKK